MKYTEEQRLDIAKHVYDRNLTVEEAAVKYDLSVSSVEKYLRLYRAKMGLKPRVYPCFFTSAASPSSLEISANSSI